MTNLGLLLSSLDPAALLVVIHGAWPSSGVCHGIKDRTHVFAKIIVVLLNEYSVGNQIVSVYNVVA